MQGCRAVRARSWPSEAGLYVTPLHHPAIVAALALLALLLPALPRALALVAAGRAAEGREAELTHQAFHDPLTGLPNRALFLDRLQQAVYRAGREPGSRFAILFLDLDHL